MMSSFSPRLDNLREAMAAFQTDAVLIPPSSDYRYFTASPKQAAQRPVVLLLTPHDAFLLMPGFECGNEPELTERFSLVPYSDSDDPIAVLAAHLPAKGRVAVCPEMKAGLLLALHQRCPMLTFADAAPILEPLRRKKDAQELEILETAQHMAERALSRLLSESPIGKTEKQLATRLMQLRLEEGFDAVGSGIVASGPNTALAHHVIGDRVVCKGDALMFDIGGTYKGYHADFTRTFSIGHPSEDFKTVYGIVLEAHLAGVQAAKPGVRACDVDLAARAVIERAGYGPFFTHRLGHGIGLDVHEPPFISSVSTLPLEPGNVFSCEPGIYLPGRFGIRIEDLLAMDKHGVHSLNTLSKELTVL